MGADFLLFFPLAGLLNA